MNKDTIYCSDCQKEIIVSHETYVKKGITWDLYCIHCDSFIGQMLDLLGWTI